MLEFTSHDYDGFVFDENDNRIDFKGYRADCINDMALEFFDTYDRKKPFFMTISQIEPHYQKTGSTTRVRTAPRRCSKTSFSRRT